MDHPGADRDQVTGGIRYVTDVPYIAGFTAELAGSLKPEVLQGDACRDRAGEWTIGKVTPKRV